MKKILAIIVAATQLIQLSANNKAGKWHDVTVTVYNPVYSQCDDTPLITASGRQVNLKKLKSGKIRWIAVSRDLLKVFPYGSSVYVWIMPNHPRNGSYIVADTMNSRFKKRIDILTFDQKKGKWNGKIQMNP